MAENPYINKVEANNQTLIDLTSDTATAGDVLEGRTLHLASGAPAVGTYRPSDEIEARLESTVGHSSKNLLDISGQDSTNYGVRWYEENGRLRAVGTYNDNAAHSQPRFYTKLKASSYIFSGSPIYRETGVRIQIGTCLDAQGTSFTALGYDEGNGFTFTLQSDSWVSIRMYTARNLYQQSIDLTLPVMFRDGSISDDTFEPYVTPTDEKKQDKPVVLWEATTKSEMTEQVTFSTTEIENIGYFIVFVEVKSEDAVTDVVTFIVYNGMFFGEVNYYHNISTKLTFTIEEGIASISVETADVHVPKIIKIIGIPK